MVKKMFEFIKKLFAKEEAEEQEKENIKLDKLEEWLNPKAEAVSNELTGNISSIKNKIEEGIKKAKSNLDTLKDAKLKNPNIPIRAKQMMEGNRVSYVKIASNFLDYLWKEVKDEQDYEKLLGFSNDFDKSLDSLGKSTTRSYHVIKEFFANEATEIAINIKNIDGFFKELKSAIENSNMAKIDVLKKEIISMKNRINQKTNLRGQLKSKEEELKKLNEGKEELLKEITSLKNSEEYSDFNNLKQEKEAVERQIKIGKEDVFHSFSAIDKALKKYVRIAFEDEKLLSNYIINPVNALLGDEELGVIKILESLEKNLIQGKIELDEKKKGKTLVEIKKLNKSFFVDFLNNHNKLNEKLKDIEDKVENSEVKGKFKELNERLNKVNANLEKTENIRGFLNKGMEKIDLEKMKDNLQNEINHLLKVDVLIE